MNPNRSKQWFYPCFDIGNISHSNQIKTNVELTQLNMLIGY